MREIVDLTARAYGGRAEIDYRRGYPVMVNSEEQTAFAAEVASAVSGDCADAPLVMGGEDFAFMLEERPGAYILVGNGDRNTTSTTRRSRRAVRGGPRSWNGGCRRPEQGFAAPRRIVRRQQVFPRRR